MPEGGHLTFVLGGARSGKSRHAETLVSAYAAPWHYLATAEAHDDEMRRRIASHRERRNSRWTTVEAPLDLVTAISKVPDGEALLIDCLTLWLSNLLLAEHQDIGGACARLTDTLARPRGPWVVVANEVGLGIVPDNALARRFRDEAGRLNQRVAEKADSVVMVVAGLPLKVK